MNKEQKELLCLIVDDAYCISKQGLDKDQIYYLKLVQGNLSELKQELKLKREDEE